jgi:hypothetical protein
MATRALCAKLTTGVICQRHAEITAHVSQEVPRTNVFVHVSFIILVFIAIFI